MHLTFIVTKVKNVRWTRMIALIVQKKLGFWITKIQIDVQVQQTPLRS